MYACIYYCCWIRIHVFMAYPDPRTLKKGHFYLERCLVEQKYPVNSGVYFIHFNHTNPALNENSNAYLSIMKNGFHVAKAKEVFPL